MKEAREGSVHARLRIATVLTVAIGWATAALGAPSDAPTPAPAETGAAAPGADAGPATQAASAAVEAAPVAPWPPPLLDELPSRDPARALIDRAWRLPAGSLEERVERTQRAGMTLGLRELEGPARALLFSSEAPSARERAMLAIQLAPGLPASHASLARVALEAGDLPAAWNALRAALDATPAHLEARAWASAVASEAAVHTGFVLAALFALLGAAAAIPSLTYGLGASRLALAGPGALAAIGAAVMALALLEGPAGAVLGLGAVAVASGSATKRLGVAAALGAGLLALHGGFDRLAEGKLLLAADPVATSVHRIEAGLATPADVGTALRAASSEAAAARAIALYTKRAGDREAAAQYFARVLAQRPGADVLNNAASVAFARGDVVGAISLFEQATQLEPTATGYFNLSQAYGRAIRLDAQDRALASAQALDPVVVERLTSGAVTEEIFVSDQPFSVDAVAARAWATGAPAQLAALLRERWAPGMLGTSLGAAALLALLVLGAAAVGGTALERRVGPRDFYADLARTLHSAAGDSAVRVAQLTRLRTRRARTERMLSAVALVVPGAAGFRFGRPLAALLATLAFAAGVAIAAALATAPPDPMSVGALPGLLAQLSVGACVLVYAASTLAAFALRAEE